MSREEARFAVWGNDTHVDFDQGLAYGIRRIRRVLVDEGTDSKYVETIPREGYRMLAAVEFPTPAFFGVPGLNKIPSRANLSFRSFLQSSP